MTEKMVFFYKEKKGRNVDLKSLVSVLSIKYAKILSKADDLHKHSKNVHHMNAILTASDFLTYYKNPAKELINLINSSRMNQLRLKLIIELTNFRHQNISLRNHRDQSSLVRKKNNTKNFSVVYDKHFHTILRF